MAESVEEHKREPNEVEAEEVTKEEPTKELERRGEEKAEDTKMAEGMIPKAKLTAVSMFTSLAESVQNIQANMPDMSNYGIGRKHPDIVFPPPSWNVEELEKKERAEEVPAEEKKAEGGEEEKEEKEEPDESAPAPDTRDKPSNPPSPSSFAERLKVMIESLPVPPSVTSTVTNAINTASGSVKSLTTPGPQPTTGTTTDGEEVEHPDPSLPPLDGSGPPVPEGVDSETIKYLSSQSVMTGMANRDGASTPSARQTVWAALEKLKPGSWGKTQTSAAPAAQEEEAGKEKGKPEDVTPETDEGVMMYAPLRPDDSSEVVLAECRTPGVGAGDSTEPPSTIDDKTTKGKAPAKSKSKEPSQPTPKLWVPSTTSLSIYTTWWGYRLYIPPPVMSQLSSSQMRATKRATLITTFLQWVLTRIPTMVVPPTMRGGLVMLKRLAPIVGYVGIFVAWSWKRIQEVDEGNGVVLTATWVLPVALIPTKWDAGDVFGPIIKPEEVQVDEENKKEKGKEKEEKKDEKKGLMERVKSFGGWGKK